MHVTPTGTGFLLEFSQPLSEIDRQRLFNTLAMVYQVPLKAGPLQAKSFITNPRLLERLIARQVNPTIMDVVLHSVLPDPILAEIPGLKPDLFRFPGVTQKTA